MAPHSPRTTGQLGRMLTHLLEIEEYGEREEQGGDGQSVPNDRQVEQVQRGLEAFEQQQ